MPIFSRRARVRKSSDIDESLRPSIFIDPELGSSSPHTRFSSVDFPSPIDHHGDAFPSADAEIYAAKGVNDGSIDGFAIVLAEIGEFDYEMGH